MVILIVAVILTANVYYIFRFYELHRRGKIIRALDEEHPAKLVALMYNNKLITEYLIKLLATNMILALVCKIINMMGWI